MSASIAAYSLADVLFQNLTVENTGTKTVLRGEAQFDAEVGPWKIRMYRKSESDEFLKERTSIFLKIRKQLWAYVFTDVSNRERLYMFLFDAKKAKIKTMEIQNFATGDTRKTVEKLRPYATAGFEFDFMSKEWKPCEIDAMDFSSGAEDVEITSASDSGKPGISPSP